MPIADTDVPTSPSATRTIPARRISFSDGLEDLAKHFAQDGDLIGSHIVACLSAVFPEGEDFFVRSVRHYRDQIADPVLKRQVAGFIGQEAVHGREHRALNERLAELGYPTERMDRQTKRGLAVRHRMAPPIWNLAMTAALEHFTATFSEVLLSNPDEHMLGDGVIADVLTWHALEECEHKAVALDVYRAVGGSEKVRVRQMNITTVLFLAGMFIEVAISVARDPASRERGRLRTSLGSLRRHPLFQRSVWLQLRDYNREGFHPDDWDTEDLLDKWRDELFGEHGRMNALLAGYSGQSA